MTDDQRSDTLAEMPFVQRELAGRGVSFSNAHVTTPHCCPSRASILTGQYASHHGVLRNNGRRGGWRGFDDRSTVATWLQAAGVRTMLVGKYLNLYRSDRVPTGWDEWFGIMDTGRKYYNYSINKNEKVKDYGDRPQDYSTEVLTEQAVRWINGEPDRPFFLYFSVEAPHTPSTPSPEDGARVPQQTLPRGPSFNEADVRDKPSWVSDLPMLDRDQVNALEEEWVNQARTLTSVDRAIERIVASLRANGRLENTWFIFTSDGGFSMGEHRYTMHKSCGYEECIHVPLLVVPPPSLSVTGTLPRVDASLALNIDIAPTIADIVGIEPPDSTDGTSLLSVLRNPAQRLRSEAILELWTESEATSFYGLRTESWKYLRYRNGEEELYDLVDDPSELTNLSGVAGYAGALTQLSKRLDLLRPNAAEIW